ncbi:MAG TPA: HlyD family efflux transporter periplasmic adaptor subunit [Clostridia bacterium]|jgi:multidrug efflux pump subunit AcrA (membrane-fusion protein)|nr:HlyD family efflux transporter periplasmic adaptor subunit [Clostridia bacterium]HQC67901.1 HlyD family efflux transporter periplasmic adaptor subunit [Clostridia bacterium]
MKTDVTKRRNIIKNIAIVFLAVMLVLTFFSNTILNYSLPEVAVQYPMYGTISSRIRGQGTVTANQTYQIYFDESRVIKSVDVRRGEIVQKGAVIYRLEDAPSDELNNANNTLTTMYINYKRALMQSTYDYSGILEEISELNKLLKEAVSIKANLEINKLLYADLQNKIRLAENKREELSVKKQELEQYLNSLKPDTSYSDEEFPVAYAIAKTDYENSKAMLDAEKENLKNLQRQLVAMANPVLEAQSAVDAKIQERDDYIALHPDTDVPTMTEIEAKENELEAAENEVPPDADKIKRIKNELNAMIYRYFEYLPVREQIDEYNKQIENLTKALNTVKNQERDINTAITFSRNRIDVLQFTHDDLYEIYLPLKARYEYGDKEAELVNVTAELISAQEEVNALNERKSTVEAKVMTEAEADALVVQRQKELNDKQASYEKLKAQNELDEQINKMNLENMKREIIEQEALVKRLQEKAINGVITAPVTGMIINLTYVTGEKTNSGAVVAEIEISEKGYTMSFTVTIEQSRRLSVGQVAQVQYYYGSNAPYAEISAIKTDYNNPRGSRIVELEVRGDNIYPGQTMYVALGETGREYEAVIPNSAIHEDNKGKFVYIVEAKNTPIGNRYIARRADIQVIASDDSSSAISGVSAYANYIITTSSKPITDGMQVRLIENKY